MKRKLDLLMILFASALVLLSCRKEMGAMMVDRVERPSASLLEAAENFYMQQIDTDDGKVKLKPKWKDSWVVYQASGPLLIVPAPEQRIQNKAIHIRRFFTFQSEQGHITAAHINELISPDLDVGKHAELLLTSAGNEEIAGFTGSMIQYDVNYVLQGSIVYQAGKRINYASSVIKSIRLEDL